MNTRNRHHTIENCVRCRALATGAPPPSSPPPPPAREPLVPEWIPEGFHVVLDPRAGLLVRCDRCESGWQSPHGQEPSVALLMALARHLYAEHPEVRRGR